MINEIEMKLSGGGKKKYKGKKKGIAVGRKKEDVQSRNDSK